MFVYEIPVFSVTDDDVLWYLEHEHCHAEITPTYDVAITDEIDPQEAQRTTESILSMFEIEDGRR